MKPRLVDAASAVQRWLPLLVAAGLLVFWYSRITGAPIVSDSMATLQMAENLAHRGVLSIDSAMPFAPSMYREPIPGIVTAALVWMSDLLYGEGLQPDYFQGERARLLKMQNIFWFSLLALCVMHAVRYWTGSLPAGLVAAIVAQGCYFYPAIRPYGIDSLFSDVPAASVLCAASLVTARAVRRESWPLAFAAGLLLGVLTLIKAAGLYVFAGLLFLLLAVALWRSRRRSFQQMLAMIAALLVGFATLVGPWVIRNQRLFDTWSVSDRGGLSLYTRALKDQMTDTEYRGAFYAWAPGALQPVMGGLTGFGPRDLEPGGRLQRFSHARPDTVLYEQERRAERAGREADAISWYYRGRAARVNEYARARDANHPHPWLAADQQLQRRALEWIRGHPLQHLGLAVPYLWRGALLIFPALLAGLAWASLRRDGELFWYCVPSFGLILFYALFANFEERYGVPAMPVAVSVAVIVLCSLWQSLGGVRR